MTDSVPHDDVRERVRQRYGEIAGRGGCCTPGGSCCSPDAAGGAQGSEKLGYSPEELSAVPAGADRGLGCGNPQAIAGLQPGQTVLDLGSGAGLDCFLAARRVGETGTVIGVDMTPEMVSTARALAAESGCGNIEYRLGEIEHLPVADGSVDVVISNCVINLSPEKDTVYRDTFRVLRPGGRVAISDVVAIGPIPDETRRDLDAYCGCVAGAATVDELESLLRQIGFVEIRVTLNRASRAFIKDWFPGSGAEAYVCSAAITARKPGGGHRGGGT